MMALTKYGELNQTKLLSYCGMNLSKHRGILEELERKSLIAKEDKTLGKKKITNYKITSKGLQFCKLIMEPYEDMFPRVEPEQKEEEKNQG